jgi:hypothetical protein
LNGGVGVEYWLNGVSVNEGQRSGGTVLYAALATDQSASPRPTTGEAAMSNQDHYHLAGGASFSIGSSRFSLGLTYTFGKKQRDLHVGGLPPEVPVLGQERMADVGFSRVVIVVGYLFGRDD